MSGILRIPRGRKFFEFHGAAMFRPAIALKQDFAALRKSFARPR
jgi:hypothetical protein